MPQVIEQASQLIERCLKAGNKNARCCNLVSLLPNFASLIFFIARNERLLLRYQCSTIIFLWGGKLFKLMDCSLMMP